MVPFNGTLRLVTRREAKSLPYSWMAKYFRKSVTGRVMG